MTARNSVNGIISSAEGARPSALFDRVIGSSDGLVIAGASGLIAEHALTGLRRLGIEPLALADNNPSLWGQTESGLAVLPPEEAVHRYPNAGYIAAVFTHTPLRRQLSEQGASHVISYAPLFYRYPAAFLPYFALESPAEIVKQADSVKRAAVIWADEESAALYRAILQWFVTLDSDVVPAPLAASETYFLDKLRLRPDEVFVDCGAYDGDTVLAYASASGGRYRRIIALEPDPTTYRRLEERSANLADVVALNAAAGSSAGSIRFLASGALSSHALSQGAQGLHVPGQVIDVAVVKLDDLLPAPTYVKMDIEGFEGEALAGSESLLSSGCTAFAVTLYHRMRDLWQLPLYIHDRAPQLRLFLRHYAEDWAETVCYALPADRVGTPDDSRE